ncbi:MAG: type IV pilin-like G/H family protein, partial [Microcoleus sp.]
MRQEDSQSNSILPKGCGCLVLLMCIGVMGAIVIPIFLSKQNQSKQSEGKYYISVLNRCQQAKFAENGTFATSVDPLELGIKTETKWYKYSSHDTKTAVFYYALAKEEMLKNYVGAVFVVPAYPNAAKDAMTTEAILCEADSPGTIKPPEPTYQNGKVICGKGTTEWSRYKHSEAKDYVSLMNQGQQAYYAENGAFVGNFVEALGMGIKTETTKYKYSTRATKQAAFNYAV